MVGSAVLDAVGETVFVAVGNTVGRMVGVSLVGIDDDGEEWTTTRKSEHNQKTKVFMASNRLTQLWEAQGDDD